MVCSLQQCFNLVFIFLHYKMIKTQPQLENKPAKTVFSSYYAVNRISPSSGGNAFTPTNSSVTSVFETAENAFNLSKSVLEFTVVVPGINGSAILIPSDFCSFFDLIQVKSASGEIIVNIDNVDRYTKCALATMVDFTEQIDSAGFMVPSDRTDNGQSIAQDGYIDTTVGAGGAYVNVVVPASSSGSYRKYITPRTFSATGNSYTAGTGLQFSFSIPLKSLLPDTIFALDKDLYLKPMRFDFRFKAAQFWGFAAADGAGPPAPPLVGGTAPIVPSAISNLVLLTYTQSNQQITDVLRNSLVEIAMPYVYSNSYSYNGTGQQSSNFKIVSPSQSQNRLLKTYFIATIADSVNGVISLCNSSNLQLPVGFLANNSSAVAGTIDVLQNPKLYNSFQQYIKGRLTLQYNSIADLIGHTHVTSFHNFKGALDYMLNSVVVTSMITEKLSRHYDGDTFEGLFFENNQTDIITNINSVVLAGTPLQHYLFSIVLVKAFIKDGIIAYQPPPSAVQN